jgi:hypothetical protein
MMVCDYNGWNDAPEEEREALELLEPSLLTRPLTAHPRATRIQPPLSDSDPGPRRRAA